MRRLLLLLLLCAGLMGNSVIISQPSGAPVTQFFASVMSETSDWVGAPIQYSKLFGDNYPEAQWPTTDQGDFSAIGASGQLCNFQISQKGGTLDAADSGYVATVRLCAGGDIANCTWTDTALSVTIASDDGTSDISWIDTDCVNVTAGDAVNVKWDSTGASTKWSSGVQEAPEMYVEFTGSNINESFISSTAIRNSTATGDNFWSPLGPNASGVWALGQDVQIPIPGSFTLTGAFFSLEASPGGTSTFNVCEAGAGSDAACDGTGALRMSCSVATTGATACSDTSCSGDCDFVAGDLIYIGTDRSDSGHRRSAALRFTNTARQWFNGFSASQTLALTGTQEMSTRGRAFNLCTTAGAEDPQCMIYLPAAWTVVHIQGWMKVGTAMTDGTIDVSMRESGVDSAPNCTFSTGASTCSETTSETFDAGDYFNWQAEASAAPAPAGGDYYSVTARWESK